MKFKITQFKILHFFVYNFSFVQVYLVHDNFFQIESGSVLGFQSNWRSLFGDEQKHASNWIFLSREKVPLLGIANPCFIRVPPVKNSQKKIFSEKNFFLKIFLLKIPFVRHQIKIANCSEILKPTRSQSDKNYHALTFK